MGLSSKSCQLNTEILHVHFPRCHDMSNLWRSGKEMICWQWQYIESQCCLQAFGLYIVFSLSWQVKASPIQWGNTYGWLRQWNAKDGLLVCKTVLTEKKRIKRNLTRCERKWQDLYGKSTHIVQQLLITKTKILCLFWIFWNCFYLIALVYIIG